MRFLPGTGSTWIGAAVVLAALSFGTTRTLVTSSRLFWSRGIVVTSLEDTASPPAGTVTLRSALDTVRSGGRIIFDSALDGQSIRLTLVGEEHTILRGESYAGGPFQGFVDRDYGRSALYTRKNVTIDASALPHGITLEWGGGAESQARVLAVYGDLTLRNVTITGGHVVAEPIANPDQPYTLARGGGLAVWGTATLSNCRIRFNRVEGDQNGSRDRGAFGGGIYANRLLISDSIVASNVARGYGAAGGGVYSVGGQGMPGRGSVIRRSAISGNAVMAQHAYGGGVFSEGGGPGNRETLVLDNTTIAANRIDDDPLLPEPAGSQYYYRGGGAYMTNGSLRVTHCTIVQNVVTGIPAIFRGRPNMGGGGIAATIGNAHVVETIELSSSIVAGNVLQGAPEDLFTGSLLHFLSHGYNRVGVLDFSQILVPIPPWECLSRKHWPKEGDRDAVVVEEVLDLERVEYDVFPPSGRAEDLEPAPLWFTPTGDAVDQLPRRTYSIPFLMAEFSGPTGTFLENVLADLRANYADELGSDFGSGFGDLSGITFTPTPETWPAEPDNADWIKFWRDLDTEIDGRLGTAGLNDEYWVRFRPEAGAGIALRGRTVYSSHRAIGFDQCGRFRGLRTRADIGAIER